MVLLDKNIAFFSDGVRFNNNVGMVRRTALRHPTKPPDPLGVLTKGQHISSVQSDVMDIWFAGETPARAEIYASLVSHQLKAGRIMGMTFSLTNNTPLLTVRVKSKENLREQGWMAQKKN